MKRSQNQYEEIIQSDFPLIHKVNLLYNCRINQVESYLCKRFSKGSMRKLAVILFLISASGLFGQIDPTANMVWATTDSISGGSLTMILAPELEELLKTKEAEECKRAAYEPPRKLSPADKCATQQKIMGYKIQIFYTKDRQAAEKVKDDFSNQHPDMTPELIYASPDYRILVGDYFTRETARADLRRIQRKYPGAFTVQWRVWCRKAL